MRQAGILFVAIGLAVITYALIMDVTVSYGEMYWERVANSELMSRRIMLSILGAAATVSGVVLISLSIKNQSHGNRPDTGDSTACPICAESIRVAATKCRFCGSDLKSSVKGRFSAVIPTGSSNNHGWVVIIPAEYPAQTERRIGVAVELGQTVLSGNESPIICGYFDSRPDADTVCKRLYAECEIKAQTKYVPMPCSPIS